METDEELVEVFSAGNMFVAQAAIDEVLAPAGIEAVVHDRSSVMLPAAGTGAFFVAVPLSRVEEAMDALQEAMDDGVIEGDFVTHEETQPG